jgi:hypothetical protein
VSIPEPENDDVKVDPDTVPPSGIPENPSTTPEPKPRPPGSDQGIEEAEQQPDASL